MANEPLVGKRMVRITSHRKKHDWARLLEEIANQYKHAERNETPRRKQRGICF